MGLDKIAENKIRQAMADGEFDNLPHGKAIDLEEYFKLPAELRLAFSVLKSANCLPEEVELLKEIGELERRLATPRDHSDRTEMQKALEARRLRLALLRERRPAVSSSL